MDTFGKTLKDIKPTVKERNYSTSNDCKKEQYLLPETETTQIGRAHV